MEEEEKGKILDPPHRDSISRIKLKLEKGVKKSRSRSRNKDLAGGGIGEGEARCSLCGRRFCSMKSLFGHMRCHPERPWRGINPPPIDSAPTTAAVHLSQSLPGWSVTGKRGRNRTPGSGAEDEIVHDLLMLAQASPIEEGDSGTNNWGFVMGSEEEEPKELNLNLNLKTMRKRRKKKRLRDLEIAENKYNCSVCNKTFKTHQALGGHKSSHNKHTHKTPSMDIENATKPTSSNHMDMEEEVQHEHQCKVCDKSFSSGQALGGHKRSHWTGAHQQPSSQVTSASGTGHKILGFDLNYPPPMDQDEEGIDSGFFNVELMHIQ